MKKALKKTNSITAFRLSLMFLITLMMCGSALAMDPLEPPASDILKWQLQAGFEYSFSSMDIKLTNGSYIEESTSQPTETGDAIDVDIENIDLDKLHLYFGFGIEKNFELFVRLGAARAEFENDLLDPLGKFDSDYAPSIGGGLRMTFMEDRNLKIGGVVQASWTKNTGKITPSVFFSPSFITMDMTEIQVALGALYQWTDYISFYGGPFYRYVTGDFEDQYIGYNNIGAYTINDKFTWDIESNSDFGGYLGTQVELDKNFFLTCEYQMASNADTLAAGVMLKY
ncbi:MAG: hypothetical protein P8016_01440 [Sedimentisphaerales bacterium]